MYDDSDEKKHIVVYVGFKHMVYKYYMHDPLRTQPCTTSKTKAATKIIGKPNWKTHTLKSSKPVEKPANSLGPYFFFGGHTLNR